MSEDFIELPSRPLADLTLDHILWSIHQTGSKMAAATQLGITKATIYRALRKGYSDGRKFKIVKDGPRRYKVEWPTRKPVAATHESD
jgi:transposase